MGRTIMSGTLIPGQDGRCTFGLLEHQDIYCLRMAIMNGHARIEEDDLLRALENPVETLSFVVLGEPTPEGSTRAYYIKALDRTVTTHQNKKGLQAWRNRVATEAQRALDGREWKCDPCSAYSVSVDFVLSRPPSVPEHRRLHPTVKPDIDKLVRAINDALTGILFSDDCQVVAMSMSKDYCDERRAGAYVTVCRYPNQIERPKRSRKKAEVSVPKAEEEPCEDPRD
ncbi:MAG: RusA family crossover junction endodeoxyribonuclease [Methanomassiliicoccus sp.]|nr:RusA family crossover junction endodeoxyribonuclease [Methanomassiliicoccus sp.]